MPTTSHFALTRTTSRFVKAAFTKLNSVSGDSESESVSQFFHILASVSQQKGCCRMEHGFEYIIYSSSVIPTREFIITRLMRTAKSPECTDLDGMEFVNYPLVQGQQMKMQNRQAIRQGFIRKTISAAYLP